MCNIATWSRILFRRGRVGNSPDQESRLPGIHANAMNGDPIAFSNVKLQPRSLAAHENPVNSSSSKIRASDSRSCITVSCEAWRIKRGTRTAQLSPSVKVTLNTRHWPPSKYGRRVGICLSLRSWDMAIGIAFRRKTAVA